MSTSPQTGAQRTIVVELEQDPEVTRDVSRLVTLLCEKQTHLRISSPRVLPLVLFPRVL